MVIATTTEMGLRCSSCGREDEQKISMFVFGAFPLVKVACVCGGQLFSISTKDRRRFQLNLTCPLCQETHTYNLSRAQLWTEKGFSLYCPRSGREIAHLAPQETGTHQPVSDGGTERDYFINRAVMCTILDRLHRMINQGSLSCQCGNLDLELEIFPDRVGFFCEHCGAWGSISAQFEADGEAFTSIDEIQLVQNTRVHDPNGASNEPTRSRKRRNI
ncbi:MAG: hypothetical protein HPY50_08230 [Firmicutes bacterium]|nr:hypothetical protein [Bacillota bacterium]